MSGARDTSRDTAASAFGGHAIPRTMLLSSQVGRELAVGSHFGYVFDLGDDWTHACTVENQVDPLEVLGARPDRPMVYWGWGTIPDQYGRRWDSDDGASDPPPIRPEDRLGGSEPGSTPLIALSEFRRAVASGNAGDVLEAVSAVEIETALQQVGAGLLRTYRLAKRAEQTSLSPVLLSVLQRLKLRGWVGDDIVSAEMLAEVRGEEPDGRPLAIDLGEPISTMTDRGDYPGGHLNAQTGEVIPAALTDELAVGEEYAVDVEDGDWVHLIETGEEGWQDMADFTTAVRDPRIREVLEDAVHGRGAFSRFRRAIDQADLAAEWHCFADDRQWGRARQRLAQLGLRPA